MRQFDLATIRRLTLIRMGARAGMPLREIGHLWTPPKGLSARRQWQILARGKLPEIDASIAEQQNLRELVGALP